MTTETPAMRPQNWSNSRITNGKNICLLTYTTREDCTQRLHWGWSKKRHTPSIRSIRCLLLFLHQ
jgi:hypothetical protein